MRRKLREIAERITAVFMFVCIISGIILMMCESEDWNAQRLTLFGGFSLFLVGILPGVIISLREGRRERG